MATNKQLIKKITKKLSPNIKRKLAMQTSRKEMLMKYGEKAFLDSDSLKYPVFDPYTGKYNCELLALAYLNAKERKDEQILIKAKDLLNQNKCSLNSELQLEAAEKIEIQHHKDRPIYNKPEKTNLDIYAQYRGQLRKNTDQCICPECGFETALSLDIPSCSSQTCPVCGEKMKDLDKHESLKTDKTEKLSELVREVFDGLQETEEAKFICDSCSSVVTYDTKNTLEGKCPKCDDELHLLRETIEGKRNQCPRCNSSYKYINTSENVICHVCGKYTYVTDNITYNKKTRKSLPIETV